MSNLIELIRDNASIEEIKADLSKNRHNEDYINIRDKYGRTALFWACIYNSIEAVKLLLEADADVNIVSGWGIGALDIAEHYGYNEIVWLLNNHNKPNKPNNYIMFNGIKYNLVEEI